MDNKKVADLQIIHGPIAIILIAWIWVGWCIAIQAPNLANDDISLGWYYFFLSVAYSVVILVSRRVKAGSPQRHQLSIGGHAFFLLAWYAIRMKPEVKPNDDRMLVNEYYLFAFIVTLTLGLLVPFVAYHAAVQEKPKLGHDSHATNAPPGTTASTPGANEADQTTTPAVA